MRGQRAGRVALAGLGLGLGLGCTAPPGGSHLAGLPPPPSVPAPAGDATSNPSPSPSGLRLHRVDLPPQMAPAVGASVVFRVGDTGGCSATKVGEGLLLSAAHCLVGYTGLEPLGAARFERDGRAFPLTVAEQGAFEPGAGKMADWVLLRAEDEAALAGVPSASLAREVDVARTLSELSDEIDEREHAVWTVTFPVPSHRSFPRTAMVGGKFGARGFLKSAAAYRKAMVLALTEQTIYDDRGPTPRVPEDFESRWASTASPRPDLCSIRGGLDAVGVSFGRLRAGQ